MTDVRVRPIATHFFKVHYNRCSLSSFLFLPFFSSRPSLFFFHPRPSFSFLLLNSLGGSLQITRTETSFSPPCVLPKIFLPRSYIPNHLLPPINFYFYLYSCSLRYARSLFPFNISFCTRG